MTTIGVVSPGAMGSALARAWAGGGSTVLTTVDGRSRRTRHLAEGLTQLPDVAAVVAASDVVVSICPPHASSDVLDSVLAAANAQDARPVVADLNAVAPDTVEGYAARAARRGIDLIDGSISGGPPRPGGDTHLYLSGEQAAVLAGLRADGLRTRVVGDRPGLASAVKMCTASVYKGTTALWAQALQTAHELGVLDVVLADLAEAFPETAERAARLVATATSKSDRFVAEMEEIAATQRAAGVSGELFDGMAAVYRRLSSTELAGSTPEEARDMRELTEVLRRLR